jgi:hypothetical protein
VHVLYVGVSPCFRLILTITDRSMGCQTLPNNGRQNQRLPRV